MRFRLALSGMALLICLGFYGCSLSGEGQVDEQRNPYFIAGKERVAERDYKGAIESFEKALESNPRSAQAHFELGVLYEQHTDQKEEDYVSAMYHYTQAIRLRPNDYPADNARQRVASCKRELVKAESLAPVAQNLMRELDKLKEENRLLRKQQESSTPQLASRGPALVKPSPDRHDIANSPGPVSASPTNPASTISRTSAPISLRDRVTPLPLPATASRTHTVKSLDTLYSIARQYHVKLDTLLAANPNLDPKRLTVGQVLKVPSN